MTPEILEVVECCCPAGPHLMIRTAEGWWFTMFGRWYSPDHEDTEPTGQNRPHPNPEEAVADLVRWLVVSAGRSDD